MDFDISGLSNANLIQQSLDIQTQEAQTNNFKSVLDQAVANEDDKQLKNAAKEFEAYFINLMFSQMRGTINYSEGVFQRSQAEEIFQGMLDEEVAKSSAEVGGIGLADIIYEQLSRDFKVE